MKLTKVEMEVIGKALYAQRKDMDYSKGFQNRGENLTYKNFEKTSLGKIHKKVGLKGILEEIYKTAFKTPIEHRLEEGRDDYAIQSIANEIINDESRKLDLKGEFVSFAEDMTYVEISKKRLSQKTFNDFKPFFSPFRAYGSEVEEMFIINKGNIENGESNLRVVFIHKGEKIWNLDFPLIDKDCFFTTKNNVYAFMYTIGNMKEIIAGKTRKLELQHPYTYLCKELLKAYTEDGEPKLYSEEIFNNLIFSSRRENNRRLQNKLLGILRHAKGNAWDKTEETPVVWFDKHSSAISKFSYTRNVLIDSNYTDLVKIGLLEGLDMLTGSTSTPAKRVKAAAGWEIVREGSQINLKKIKETDSIIENYAGEFKCFFPAFVKTSAKRDNSCTIKDTVNFTNPQTYERKVKIK